MQQADLFQRAVFAKELIEMVKELPTPYAFGLDADWGSGKTFFIQNCLSTPAADLDVPYIVYDAFEHEKDGDVLLSLMTNIVEQVLEYSEKVQEKTKFEIALKNVVKKNS